MSWTGNILRVDLDAGTCVSEPLNSDWAALYLGQRGLATKYICEEVDPAVDPLDPANKLIFASGPLTGTMSATGGRYSVVTKGALTGAIACSNSGGKFGAEFKRAGWDMIIIEGRATSPVYLHIEDGDATLLPANDLWGTSVWDCEATIRARHQDPQLKIASIGRAGECGVRYACVINDHDRAAGRSGVGAVMGAKQLKAIAVRGTRGVQVHDPKAFMAAIKAARAKLDPNPNRKRLGDVGTHAMLDVINAFGGLPTRNNRDVVFEGVHKINAAAVKVSRPGDGRPNLVSTKACFACTIACGRVATIDPDHFTVAGGTEYKHASGGLEFESAYALGSMVGVDDLDAVTYANFVCNEQGMDTISFGATLSAAMELYETGVITDTETGGVALNFGSAEALASMVQLTAKGEGFGIDIGLGAKRLGEKYGHPEVFMGVKGQEFAGYDGRAMPGMALAYATSNRGACHLRASPYASDFATSDLEGKAAIVAATQDERASTHDSAGICMFTAGALDLDDIAGQLEAACGGGWTGERLRETGERIWNLERLFNLGAGFTAADDTLPDRILKEPANAGSAKGKTAELGRLLPEYYQVRGWDENGVPTAETLNRLGIE
ncbi:MAG: aldehyde ferredoxin oxidoreductase family protein [Alphaproteobacteria bacterium]|mgnify:FL=1